MNIFYDDNNQVYTITLDDEETITYICTNNIAEAREIFLERMQRLFDYAINEKLQ